jgi:hypothetical protein
MATTMESATTGAIASNGRDQVESFRGMFTVIPFTFTFEEDSIAAEASSTADIVVTGARLGDFVLIAPTVDTVSVLLSAFVSAANQVTVVAQNLEVSDANTTLATVATHNGLILRRVSASWPTI